MKILCTVLYCPCYLPGANGMVMSGDNKRRLERHRPELVENLIPAEVINHLRADEVLTPREADGISRAGGVYAQNEALLNTLLRKPNGVFDIFLQSMKNTGQQHLAQLLRQ